jgi:DNA polymerase III subunit delta
VTAAPPTLGPMPELNPVYLVCGDDDAKIDAWRARVRARAEAEQGPGALELYESGSGPDEVADALSALTFGTGDRYVLADGVEAWKAGDLDPLERTISDMPPDTVLVMIARGSPPQRLSKAVRTAGGDMREYQAPKGRELPRWLIERAAELGLQADQQAARALIAVAGQRQQRLVRELEKLALAIHPERQLTADHVVELASGDTTRQVYDLSDAVVAGDLTAVLSLAEELTAGEDRPTKLTFPIVRRLRDVHRAAELLDAGVSESQVAGSLKMPPWAAKKMVSAARKVDRDRLERALCSFAELEIDTRGGGDTTLDEDTAFTLALTRAVS